MSRSCQSATFSSPTSALPRTTRASPQMRSAVIGLRLCGIADEPFWPRPNGSSTSRTSVRARCRISVAKRSSEAASERERRQQLGVAVALQDLRRARRGLEAETLARDPLDLRIGVGVGADRARELADAKALDRADEALAIAVERERPAGELEPERRRLGVDPVRAAHQIVSRCSSARATTAAKARSRPSSSERPGVLHGERERGVDHVGRRQPVVEPAAFLARPSGDDVDERGDVVVRLALDLGDALGRRHDRPLADRRDRLGGDDADLGPALEGSQLDLEPAPQLLALRPDAAHGRAGVARDHRCILGAAPEAAAPAFAVQGRISRSS